ncbi:MAG TPA: zinc-ribbon domain-containing protein [Geobacteraceae bacterium]|nr:zinc-ribbon domain-containing protein [Geobacteraceae bacterium]
MKIECPECKLSGNVDDSMVPATGIAMNCPRCKARFVVERPRFSQEQAEAMLDTCPSCQYATFSEEKFAVCPKCGLVVADYQLQLRAGRKTEKSGENTSPAVPAMTAEQQRRDEEARKKYGLDGATGEVGNGTPAMVGTAQLPTPLLVVGWGTIAVALGLLIYGVSGVVEYLSRLKDAQTALQAGDEAPSVADLFFRFALFPLLMVAYGIAMAFLANRFLALRLWAVRSLETGGWTGVCLAAAMELADIVAWFARSSSGASIGYYATGLLSGVLMALLWMFPPFVLVEYLRSEQFDRLGDYFG